MATLLLSAVQMFCGIPAAPVIGSVLAALMPINPINLITFVGWFLGIKYSKAKWIQGFKGTWKVMLKWAAMFYFLTLVPIYAITIFFACRAV